MNIDVLFFGRLRELAAERQKTICLKEGARLSDLIDCLVEEHGIKFHQAVSRVEQLILINGQVFDNTQTELKDGDIVSFLPVIAGG